MCDRLIDTIADLKKKEAATLPCDGHLGGIADFEDENKGNWLKSAAIRLARWSHKGMRKAAEEGVECDLFDQGNHYYDEEITEQVSGVKALLGDIWEGVGARFEAASNCK